MLSTPRTTYRTTHHTVGQATQSESGGSAVGAGSGAGGEHVVAAELEHEVKQVVVVERGAGLGLERLGRDLPHLGADAAGHEQRDDVVVGGLAGLVPAARADEGVVAERSVVADTQRDVGARQLDLSAGRARGLDGGHAAIPFRHAFLPRADEFGSTGRMLDGIIRTIL